MFDLTPEEAAVAVSKADSEAAASRERLEHAKEAGQLKVTPMDRLQQVTAQVEKCDKIVEIFNEQRPVSYCSKKPKCIP